MERMRVVRVLSWVYIAFGITSWLLMLHPGLKGKHPVVYAILGAVGLLWILAGIGARIRSKWGFIVAIFVSVLILLAFPVGTILGGVMGYCLIKECGQYWHRQDAGESGAEVRRH